MSTRACGGRHTERDGNEDEARERIIQMLKRTIDMAPNATIASMMWPYLRDAIMRRSRAQIARMERVRGLR